MLQHNNILQHCSALCLLLLLHDCVTLAFLAAQAQLVGQEAADAAQAFSTVQHIMLHNCTVLDGAFFSALACPRLTVLSMHTVTICPSAAASLGQLATALPAECKLNVTEMESEGLSAHPQLLQRIACLVHSTQEPQHAPSMTRLEVLQLHKREMPFAVFRTLMANNPALRVVHLLCITPPADGSVGSLEQPPPVLQELELRYIADPLLLPWLPQVGCA
jgi:hypothetical protein